MKYKLTTTRRFDKAVLKCISRGYDIAKLHKAMTILVDEGSLPSSYRPHKLKGYKFGNVILNQIGFLYGSNMMMYYFL